MIRMWLVLAMVCAAVVPGVRSFAQTTPLVLLAAAPAPASAVPPTAALPAITPAEAQRTLDMLTDDRKRADFIATLQTLARAAPAAPATAAPPAVAVAGAVPPSGAADKPLPLPLMPDSLGADLLESGSAWLAHAPAEAFAALRSAINVASVRNWAVMMATDPLAQERLQDTAWRLAVVAGAGLLVERLLMRGVLRYRRAVEARGAAAAIVRAGLDAQRPGTHGLPSSATVLRRVPLALARLALNLLPVLGLAIVSHALIGSKVGGLHLTRLVLLAVVDGYIVCRLLLALVALLLAPGQPGLRLVPLPDDAASVARIWLARIIVILVLGYAAAEVGLMFGLSPRAHDGVLKLVALLVVVLLQIVIFQLRHPVGALIRGPAGAPGVVASLRTWVSVAWPRMAFVYLLALWVVWAIEIPNGFERLLRFFVVTTAVIAGMRALTVALLRGLDRWLLRGGKTAGAGVGGRLQSYRLALRAGLTGLMVGTAAILLLQLWGLDALDWFAGNGLGSRALAALGNIGVTLAIALLVWEGTAILTEQQLARLTREAQLARSARLRTLLPMLRTTLLIVILVIVGLMILSEIGVNIAPLLAGAGVIGLAIGFGSQKLVQDIITGLFLLLENTMQVGDTVQLAGLTGTVENLSVRTIRLRALDGAVHMVPFSAVTTVTNMTRDYGYAVVDVGVGLNEEPDHIVGVLRDIAREMRAEPRWQGAIRDDIEVMGVERFVDQAWVMRARLKTQPTQRWAVGRELNRRLKYRFDELAIESPITSYRVLSAVPPAQPPAEAAEPVGEGSPR